MASLKRGKDWAPLNTFSTFTRLLFGAAFPKKNVGVPRTPAARPSLKSLTIP